MDLDPNGQKISPAAKSSKLMKGLSAIKGRKFTPSAFIQMIPTIYGVSGLYQTIMITMHKKVVNFGEFFIK